MCVDNEFVERSGQQSPSARSLGDPQHDPFVAGDVEPTGGPNASSGLVPIESDLLEASWLAYRQARDPQLRARLLLTFIPMVAERVMRCPVESGQAGVSEMAARGVDAILEAIDCFRPGLGPSLDQFVWLAIRNATRRGEAPIAHVARRAGEETRELAVSRFLDRSAHWPTRAELIDRP